MKLLLALLFVSTSAVSQTPIKSSTAAELIEKLAPADPKDIFKFVLSQH